MSDLLQKLKAGSQTNKEIKWPGTEDVINIRVYNDNDHLLAVQATDKIITNVTMANVERYNAELYTQLLHRVITDPADGKNLGSVTEFRSLLSPEVKKILLDELDALHEEHSPDPERMTDEEFDVLFNDVKKNAGKTVLNISNIFTLRRLVLSLVPKSKK